MDLNTAPKSAPSGFHRPALGGSPTGISIHRRNGDILPTAALAELKSALNCSLVEKGQVPPEEYGAAIDRWNQTGVREAAVIVFCESENDISICLRWVKKWGLDLAISGGRHTFHAASSTEGLVIDMRKMQKVAVEKVSMQVLAQGGCLAEQVEAAAEAEGLSVGFGAVGETGIGGLTLGGGSGWLTGQYGHTIDYLLSARVVLADGTIVIASESENSDLFWAIRGGGSNFGVCAEFTYKAYLQGPVLFGFLLYSPDKMQTCVEHMNTLYDSAVEPSGGKFQMYFSVVKPAGVPAACPMYIIYYNGPEDKGRAYAAPLFALEPLQTTLSMTNYASITALNKSMSAGNQHHRYTCSVAQMELPLDTDTLMTYQEDFNTFLAKYGEAVAPSKIAIELRSFAVTSAVPVSAMAYASRHKLVNITLEAQYNDPSLDVLMREEISRIVGKVRKAVAEKRGAAKQSEVLVNANFSSGLEKVSVVFGENLPRLREIKRKYDPDFIFNKWYPIPPIDA